MVFLGMFWGVLYSSSFSFLYFPDCIQYFLPQFPPKFPPSYPIFSSTILPFPPPFPLVFPSFPPSFPGVLWMYIQLYLCFSNFPPQFRLFLFPPFPLPSFPFIPLHPPSFPPKSPPYSPQRRGNPWRELVWIWRKNSAGPLLKFFLETKIFLILRQTELNLPLF